MYKVLWERITLDYALPMPFIFVHAGPYSSWIFLTQLLFPKCQFLLMCSENSNISASKLHFEKFLN